MQDGNFFGQIHAERRALAERDAELQRAEEMLLLKCVGEGMSHVELALLLGVSRQRVAQKLEAARRRLADELADRIGQERPDLLDALQRGELPI